MRYARRVRFDVYGRFLIDVVREGDRLVVLELGAEGKRRLRPDIVLDPGLDDAAIARALDDLLHELGGPGRSIREVGR